MRQFKVICPNCGLKITEICWDIPEEAEIKCPECGFSIYYKRARKHKDVSERTQKIMEL